MLSKFQVTRIDGPEQTNPLLPLKKHLSKDPTILSLEYDALNMLALQYFPEQKISKEAPKQSPVTLNVCSSSQVPPNIPAVKQTKGGGEQPRHKNNYITQLYGWSAWWSMVERKSRPEKQQKAPVCPVLSELEKSKHRFRKSETERIKFLEKYYPRGTEDRPKKSYEEENKPI